MTSRSDMAGKKWTQEEVDTLTRMYPDYYAKEIGFILGRSASSVSTKALILGLKSSREKIRRSGLLSASHPNAVAQRFPKGHVSHNKGKKMPPEIYAKCQPTMFKKGNSPHNHREVGSERVNVYGYREVKVAEPNRWRLKHRIIWEEVNGEIPKGYNVQFKNHDSLDCRIENLYLISKAEQMKTENSMYARYPKELQDVIHLKGVVNRAIHKAQRNGK